MIVRIARQDGRDAVFDVPAQLLRSAPSDGHIHCVRHDPNRVDDILGPMAFAIMGGLLVATVLTLIFLPALYVACFRVKEPRTDGSKP
jgi:hypothetical protein